MLTFGLQRLSFCSLSLISRNNCYSVDFDCRCVPWGPITVILRRCTKTNGGFSYPCLYVPRFSAIYEPFVHKACGSPIPKLHKQEGLLSADGLVLVEPRRSARLKGVCASPLVAEDSDDLDLCRHLSEGSKELEEDADFKVSDEDNSLQSEPHQTASRRKVCFTFALSYIRLYV